MSGSVPLLLVVAVALVDEQNRILLARRPEGKKLAGLWEFPGGKVEAGERPEDALVRELQEELGIFCHPLSFSPLSFASHGYEDFHLLMPLYLCRQWEGDPQAREGQVLDWTCVEDMNNYPMPPADAPLIAPLIKSLGRKSGRLT